MLHNPHGHLLHGGCFPYGIWLGDDGYSAGSWLGGFAEIIGEDDAKTPIHEAETIDALETAVKQV